MLLKNKIERLETAAAVQKVVYRYISYAHGDERENEPISTADVYHNGVHIVTILEPESHERLVEIVKKLEIPYEPSKPGNVFDFLKIKMFHRKNAINNYEEL